MSVSPSHPRLVRKLQEALGPAICGALDDSSVVEIMLNPDGRLFVERLGQGISCLGDLQPGAAEVIIGTVAHALLTEASETRPIISGELPIGGHRFEGLLPPIVNAPTFTIRRHAVRLIPLDDYVSSAIMTAQQAHQLRQAVAQRLNIVVAGGTGSGKTTLANAVIAEVVLQFPEHRLVILEDTAEIQCAAENAVSLHTSDVIDMARLLKSTMRLRPDRIIVGEVRDGAALTLLKAWNTGHPGGVTTIHANGAAATLRRLEQLTAEASQQPMREVIGEAVNLVVSIERTPKGRTVREIIAVDGYFDGHYQIASSAAEGEKHAPNRAVYVAVAMLVAALATRPVLAAGTGGGGLPWEGPLQQIQQSITGPVAGFIALAAVAVAGGMLIFGGELNDFARRLMYVVLVAGILLGATQIVGLFDASGASIGDVDTTISAGEGAHG